MINRLRDRLGVRAGLAAPTPRSPEGARGERPAPTQVEDAPSAADAVPPEQLRDHQDNLNMRRLVAYAVRIGDSCIDVGANHGGLLHEVIRAAPHGRHIAFEPIPELCDELRSTFPAVEIRNAAASNHFGTSSFTHVRAADGWSGLRYRPLPGGMDPQVQEIEVALEPIDEILDPDFVPRLLKIDVEGAEQQVIEGAMRTIRSHRPIVVFEHGLGSANVFGTEPVDIWRLLVDEAGMRVFDLEGDGPYTLEKFAEVYADASRVNFVAHD